MEGRSLFGYRDLLVWKKGMLLAKRIYALTKMFPDEEKFGLVSQMRRASVSIPSNIAEGHARRTAKEFAQFLSHAEGSVAEQDTQLALSVELGYCTKESGREVWPMIAELQKMLDSLRRKVAAGDGQHAAAKSS